MAQAGRCALVMDGANLLGLLTTDNLSEFLLLRRFGMEPVVLKESHIFRRSGLRTGKPGCDVTGQQERISAD